MQDGQGLLQLLIPLGLGLKQKLVYGRRRPSPLDGNGRGGEAEAQDVGFEKLSFSSLPAEGWIKKEV